MDDKIDLFMTCRLHQNSRPLVHKMHGWKEILVFSKSCFTNNKLNGIFLRAKNEISVQIHLYS